MAKALPKLSFETVVRVKGKVVESVMCDCEEEGHIGIRVSRRSPRGGDYSKDDRESYFDVVAYSPDGAFLRVRPGDWVEADIVVRGRLARVPTGEVDRRGLNDGHKYEGRVMKLGKELEVDFGTFVAVLPLGEDPALKEAADAEELARGAYVESECAVEATVVRHGGREEVAGGTRRVFPRRSHG